MKCPGQDSRNWKADAIYEARCPQCNQTVEFFKDDTARRCPHCGHRFVNPEMDFGCAAYCQFAEQCLGSLPEEIKEKQQDLIKDKVGMQVRRRLMPNPDQMRCAQATARYAERIGKEAGGDLGSILMAAHLMHIFRQAEFGQEEVQTILDTVGAHETVVDKVMAILKDTFQAGPESSLETRIVHDAFQLAGAEEENRASSSSASDWNQRIQDQMLTSAGLELVPEVSLSKPQSPPKGFLD